MIRGVDILILHGLINGWAARNIKPRTRACAAFLFAVQYLQEAQEVSGLRRLHLVRCARDQWRVAVRLTAEGAR